MPEPSRGLFRFTPNGDGAATIESIVDLDEADFLAATQATKDVSRTLRPQTIQLFHSSYNALTSTLTFHGHLTASDTVNTTAALQAGMPGLNSLLFGWLSACRLFVDHSSKELSDRFGKDSPQFQRFKTATSWSFDHSLGYRFTYRLRNAFQHVGIPALSVSVSRDEATGKASLELVGDRDQLLATCKDWGPVAADIAGLPEEFPLSPLLGGSMLQHEFLAGQVRDCFRQEALTQLPLLERLLAQAGDGPGEVALMDLSEMNEDGGRFTTLPLRAAEVAALKRLPAFPSADPTPHVCAGVVDDPDCGEDAAGLVVAPHADGVALIPSCDLHLAAMGKWCVGHLGAAQLVHVVIGEYMRSGLSAAGHQATAVVDAESAAKLKPTGDTYPNMSPPPSKSGWQVPAHPELRSRAERAVRVVGAWSEQGGGTPEFFETVNQILNDDGDVEPLLTGLVNLSGMLVLMSAQLLGQTPQTLLGGLADDLEVTKPVPT